MYLFHRYEEQNYQLLSAMHNNRGHAGSVQNGITQQPELKLGLCDKTIMTSAKHLIYHWQIEYHIPKMTSNS